MQSTAWRKAWDIGFFSASLLASLLFEGAVGDAMLGIPLDARGVFTGQFVDLLHPYALMSGVVVTAMFAMHGAIYLYLKLPDGGPRELVRSSMWHTCWARSLRLTCSARSTRWRECRAHWPTSSAFLGAVSGSDQRARDRQHPAHGLYREAGVAMLQTIREFATDRLDQRPDVARGCAGPTRPTTRPVAPAPADLSGTGREVALGRSRRRRREPADRLGLLGLAARDLEQLDRLAKDAPHRSTTPTAGTSTPSGLASDMLAVLDAVPTSPERINQEIALRTTLARALMATKGFTPGGRGGLRGRARAVRAGGRRPAAVLGPARARQPVPVPRPARQVRRARPRDPRPRRGRGRSGMLIDGHLLVGHDAHELRRPRRRARPLRRGDRAVPGAADARTGRRGSATTHGSRA